MHLAPAQNTRTRHLPFFASPDHPTQLCCKQDADMFRYQVPTRYLLQMSNVTCTLHLPCAPGCSPLFLIPQRRWTAAFTTWVPACRPGQLRATRLPCASLKHGGVWLSGSSRQVDGDVAQQRTRALGEVGPRDGRRNCCRGFAGCVESGFRTNVCAMTITHNGGLVTAAYLLV